MRMWCRSAIALLSQTADVCELTLHLERIVPAPPERVFNALVTADELAKWWGPKGFTSPSIELDPRVGGSYRIAMQPPEGDVFHLSGGSSRSILPAS